MTNESTAPGLAEARALVHHIVRCCLSSPDVAYQFGFGTRNRDLLVDAASALYGMPKEEIVVRLRNVEFGDLRPYHSRLEDKIANLERKLVEACEIADALSGYISLDNPYANVRERVARIASLRLGEDS